MERRGSLRSGEVSQGSCKAGRGWGRSDGWGCQFADRRVSQVETGAAVRALQWHGRCGGQWGATARQQGSRAAEQQSRQQTQTQQQTANGEQQADWLQEALDGTAKGDALGRKSTAAMLERKTTPELAPLGARGADLPAPGRSCSLRWRARCSAWRHLKTLAAALKTVEDTRCSTWRHLKILAAALGRHLETLAAALEDT